MLIVAGYMSVEPTHRDDFVAAHEEVVLKSRQAEGCLDLAISADPSVAGRVNMYERWESQEAMDAWRAIAPSPSMKVQILGGDVAKYVIDHVEPAL